MKIAITGAAGFVGRNLSAHLIEQGHIVTGIDISTSQSSVNNSAYRYIKADTRLPGSWQEAISEADVTVNLAGKNIFGIWTPGYKKEVYESRVMTTKNVADALKTGSTLINASASGYYGNRADTMLTEDKECGDDFLAGVCRDWENEASRAEGKNARIVILRFGIIIGRKEGALKSMLPAYRFGLGGALGSGRQWFAWIHKDDLIGAITFAISNNISGIFNTCSPGLITQGQFSKSLAKAVGMPEFFPVPRILLVTFLGDFGKAITASQRAVPQKLIDLGFEFKYNDIDKALSDSL